MIDYWQQVCIRYMFLNADKVDIPDFVRYVTLWPTHLMMAHFWIWNFDRFVVYQDDMQQILDFFTEQTKVENWR